MRKYTRQDFERDFLMTLFVYLGNLGWAKAQRPGQTPHSEGIARTPCYLGNSNNCYADAAVGAIASTLLCFVLLQVTL
jgi:hypothetical protein